MFPILQVGPLAIQAPGLILLLGVWLGLTLAERHAERYDTDPNLLYNLAFIALIGGVVGARLSYAAQFSEAFIASPASLVSLNPGLLDPWGGLAVGVIVGIVYAQRKGMALWPTLDALTPALAVIGVALGLSHLASGTAFGAPSKLLWAIQLWGESRHPSQAYETLAALGILALVWPGRSGEQPPGVVFLRFMALSAGAALFLEAFRGDSMLVFGGLRAVQVAAWVVMAGCLWGLGKRTIVKNQPSLDSAIP